MFILHFLSYVFLYFYENEYLLLCFIGLSELCSSNLILFFNTNITDFILYILLQFYFRVPFPLRYPCEVLFWLSREIFKTIITYKAVLYNYNILYCIQYYHSLFNISLNNEFIPSILFSFIFLWNSFYLDSIASWVKPKTTELACICCFSTKHTFILYKQTSTI